MIFSHPWILFALGLVPVFGVLAVWRLRVNARRLAALSRHAPPVSRRVRVQVALVLAAMAVLLVALAGPRWGRTTEELTVRGRNLMLAVDVSRSMLAEDVRPNRLGRAKADLIDLVDALQGDRVGLLAFRGKGVVLCPMTSDRAYLRQSIDALAPESAPPGETDLADAIAKCLETFERAQSSHCAVVLISDGEDLAGRAEELAREAGRRKIPIFTVGIGSTRGAPIPTAAGTLQYDGRPVESRLTEKTLQVIASASGGRYIPLGSAGTAQTTLGAVYSRWLTRLADEEAREQVEQAFADRTALVAALGTLLLLAAAALSTGRVGRLAVLSAAMFLVGGLAAREPAREGQRAYREGRFEEAAQDYAAARLAAEPSQAALYAYNEALAWQKAGSVTNALACVRLAVDHHDFTARAATLEGALLLSQAAETGNDPETRLALREEALQAFTRALQAEPSERARRNLARAQSGLEALRREARRAAAVKAAKGQGLGQLVPALLQHQRALMKAVPEVYSIASAETRIRQADQLAADVRAQADRWFPVLEALPQAVTNETLRMELAARGAAEQARLERAAEAYEELAGDVSPLAEGEPFTYDLWKTFADPPALNAESIAVQTNALTSLTRYQPARDDETEVLALTQQFRLIFPDWAEQQLQQAAASTNAPPAFTEADRDVIARTADATVPLLAPPVSPERKRQVMENLLLIRKHLPRSNAPQNAPQQSPQANPKQQPQPQHEEQQKQAPRDQKAEQKPERSPEAQQEKAKKEDLQALLQKAADRQQEHEKEKQRRLRQAVPPHARDW